MKKITTLYKKRSERLSKVINDIAPKIKCVIDGEGIPIQIYTGM